MPKAMGTPGAPCSSSAPQAYPVRRSHSDRSPPSQGPGLRTPPPSRESLRPLVRRVPRPGRALPRKGRWLVHEGVRGTTVASVHGSPPPDSGPAWQACQRLPPSQHLPRSQHLPGSQHLPWTQHLPGVPQTRGPGARLSEPSSKPARSAPLVRGSSPGALRPRPSPPLPGRPRTSLIRTRTVPGEGAFPGSPHLYKSHPVRSVARIARRDPRWA